MNEVNVLIVDDEAELRKSVASILGTTMPEYLFRISEAGTGKEAIERVRVAQADGPRGRERARGRPGRVHRQPPGGGGGRPFRRVRLATGPRRASRRALACS